MLVQFVKGESHFSLEIFLPFRHLLNGVTCLIQAIPDLLDLFAELLEVEGNSLENPHLKLFISSCSYQSIQLRLELEVLSLLCYLDF